MTQKIYKLFIGYCFLIVFIFTNVLPIYYSNAGVTHGPIIGAVTTNSAKVVLRTNSEAEVYYEFDTSDSFTNPIQSSVTTAVADSDYFAVCAVNSLIPNTLYYYRAVVNGSPETETRSFKTFPEANSGENYTFHFGGCQQAAYDENSYKGNIFPVMAEEKPLFFLQIGDWTYPDTTDEESGNPGQYFALDYGGVLDTYKSKYDPNYPMNELLKLTAVDYVYDDHDMVNNNSDFTYPGITNSIRGYQAAFPHYPLASPQNGLWHKFSCGDADFFVIDTRSQRSPNITPFDTLSNGSLTYTFNPEHLILSADLTIEGELQMDWLIRELRESTATWKFIASSVPFNPTERGTVELALLLQGTSYDPLDVPGQGLMSTAEIAVDFADRWGAFPASSQKLIQAAHDYNIENVIFMSGDSHNAGIDDGEHSFFPEIMAGGLDRSHSQEIAMQGTFAIHDWNSGAQDYEANNLNNAFGRVTVFGSDSVRLEIVDEFKQKIGSKTILPGYTVETVGLGSAPEGQSFGQVEVGGSATSALIIFATGSDTVKIDNLYFSSDDFITFFPPKILVPGQARRIGMTFQPKEVRPYLEALIIESNAPGGTLTLPLVGEGINPTVVEETNKKQPYSYKLYQNYPNPFNPSTVISYQLPKESFVELTIYSISGQKVTRLISKQQPAGNHKFEWETKNLASGVYIYQLHAEEFTAFRKLLLLK